MVTPPHTSLDATSDTSPNISSAGPSDVATDMTRRCALKVMGIPQYVSKFDFPGAATAERAVLPSTSSIDLSDAEPTESVDGATPAARRVSGHDRSEDDVAVAPAQSSQRSAQSSQKKAAHGGEAVSFSMLLASAGPFLWIEQLPDGLVRQDQLALINAMARALAPAASALSQQQFHWPMTGNSALGSDAESARQALHGLIQRMAREVGAKRVIVMGACTYLPERIGQSAVCIPSTLAMLSDAHLKRDAWTALKPLKTIVLE